jgi:putative ABC transport system ATP-binding protein
MEPDYLFADEPTGNLDSINGKIVMDLFVKINKSHKTTIIYVTHDEDFADLAKRKIVLKDGQIQ